MRALWLAAAAAALGVGVWGGLTRLGTGIPPILPHHAVTHGPLMVGGFLGILAGITLAVATGRWWAWSAPALAAAGAGWAAFRPEVPPTAWILTAASGVAFLAAVEQLRRHRDLARGVTALGVFWWLAGNLEWAALGLLLVAVPCWMTFAVLVLVGQRLESDGEESRSRRETVLIAGIVILFAGLVGAYPFHELGVRVFGFGCLMIAFWGLHRDVEFPASAGQERFAAVCAASAYLWLATAGMILALRGGTLGGLIWDAALHALFLGFVFSMLFGHVAETGTVLGLRVPFSLAFYGPLVLLHLSLVLRVAGDFAGSPLGRSTGAILNMVAIAAFVLGIARAAVRGWLSDPAMD